MNANAKQSRGLFLHGGPGASALPEAMKFGDTLDIHWWTQPRPDERSPHPYRGLIVAAQNELTRMAREAGGAVKVYASSLGALLVLELAARVPQLISGITLLGPTHDAGDCFVRLGERLTEDSPRPAELREKVDAVRSHPRDRERVWSLFQAIASTPGCSDHYWSPGAKRESEWFVSLFNNTDVFDPAAFYRLLGGLLIEEPANGPIDFDGPVNAFMGTYDPFVDVGREASWWVGRFPQLVVHMVATGHYPHLELPSREWA
jgi:pimeloyl-ACP methyl ester carboxylesterase